MIVRLSPLPFLVALYPVTPTSALVPLPYQGGGTPGWSNPVQFPVGAHCHFLDVGDLNGDGRPDLVTPTRSTGTLHIRFNLGAGAFSSDFQVKTIGDPMSVVIADLDADGARDLLVVGYTTPLLRVHFGDGTGGFSTESSYALNGSGVGIDTADFNADGWLDVVVTHVASSDGARVFWNDGAGGLLAGPVLATGNTPNFVATADVDLDGRVDVAVSNFGSESVGVYLNNGVGGFSDALVTPTPGRAPGRIAIADFDLDGFPDAAVPYRSPPPPSLDWYRGDGTGTFSLGGSLAVPPTSGETGYWAEAADLNFDGLPDLVFSQALGGLVNVSVQVSAGVFGAVTEHPLGINVHGIRLADLDGNGSLDISASAHDSQALAVSFNQLFADCNSNSVPDPTDISSGTSQDCDVNGVPDECDLMQTGSDCDADGALDACEIVADPGLDLDVNGTLDSCQSAGVAYCFGDGTGAVCPCDPGQVGPAGSGCGNSIHSGGRMIAVGSALVSADSVVLEASGLLPSAFALFFQGDLQQNGGLGSAFGDGLLCANGAVIRLGVRQASQGAVQFGYRIGSDPAIHTAGNVSAAGGSRFYQLWYRDPAPFCTPSTFNLTNGVQIVWGT